MPLIEYRMPVAPMAVRFNRAYGAAASERWRIVCRFLDVALALGALAVLLPVILVLCLMVFAQDGGNPIFAHRRLGRGGTSFPCLKLRTMVRDADARLQALLANDPASRAEWLRDQKLRVDPRITPLGHFLRRSSLDELPQLLNVVMGHMSLVGPRPIVADEAPRYGRYIKYYYAVRPGLTGLWQISGRNNLSYRRRVAMDTLYSRTRSLRGDIAILSRTVPALLVSRGAF